MATALAVLVTAGAFASCSSERDTVLALTITSDDTLKDVGMVAKLRIVVSPAAGQAAMPMPVTKETTRGIGDSGTLVASFYERITLEGWKGPADVKVEALDGSGAVLVTTMIRVELVEHGAVAGTARLSLSTPDGGGQDTDAGADAGDDAGQDGSPSP